MFYFNDFYQRFKLRLFRKNGLRDNNYLTAVNNDSLLKDERERTRLVETRFKMAVTYYFVLSFHLNNR